MGLSTAERRVLGHLVAEAEDLLGAGATERAAAVLAEAEQLDGGDAGVLRLRAELLAGAGDLEHAEVLLRRALATDPDDADAHFLLAGLRGDRGAQAEMIEHYLHVHRLDEAADRRAGIGGKADVEHVEALCRDVLARIPEPFRGKLHAVPVLLEPRPHRGHVESGFDPRAVGMFEGGELGSDGVADRPTRIVLFYANLLATCGSDDELREQVEITLLHEIGHFFGLDEDDVAALGLE